MIWETFLIWGVQDMVEAAQVGCRTALILQLTTIPKYRF